MLSDRQLSLLAARVNASSDIPFISEDTEAKIIHKVLSTLNPKLEPALLALCPEPWVTCLKLALMEGISVEEKRQQIAHIIKSELQEPLAEQLSGNIDLTLVPESVEKKLMEEVAEKTIDEFVEYTVTEVEERVNMRSRDLGLEQ